MIVMLLADIDDTDIRDIENIEGSCQTIAQLKENIGDVEMFSLSDFVTACNMEKCDLENNWITYVTMADGTC